MHISGNSSIHSRALHSRNESRTTQAEKTTVPASDPSVENAGVPGETESSPSEKQPGVIRNLLGGHYKGVADVRLRINFYDQLQQIQETERSGVARTNLQEMSSSVTGEFESFLSAQDLSEEQAAIINEKKTTLDLSLAELSEQNLSSTEYIDMAEKEVQNFLQAVTEVLMESSPAESTEADSAEVTGENEGDTSDMETVTSPLDLFKEAVNAVLEEFRSLVSNTDPLPALSAPAGGGKAYSKFLSIYQQMQQGYQNVQGEAELPVETVA